MPKRIVDGEGIWRSRKLAQVQPPTYRAELANIIPLCLANGVFECDPRLAWSRCYVFNRPDVDLDMVTKVLDEFERCKLLFRWEEGGTRWAYLVGSDKPGRLPGPSRKGRHEAVGPTPPETELFDFLNPSTESNGIPSGIHKGIHDGNQPDSTADSNGSLGTGFGSEKVKVLGLENSKDDLPRSDKPTAKSNGNGQKPKAKSECHICHSAKNVTHVLGDRRFCDNCWLGKSQ